MRFTEEYLTQEDILLRLLQNDGALQWASKRMGWTGSGAEISACSWEHIECDPFDGLVTAVRIHEQRLVGTIPTELGLLTSLIDINLEGNMFYGTIPTEIFRNMPNLAFLNLNRNDLEGTIPLLTESLTALQALELNQNRLVGFLPENIGTVFQNSLEKLDVSHNEFNGSIPNSITKMRRLGYLDLSFNYLHGSIPKDIGNLKSLRGLFLNNNDLIGTVPSSMTLSELKLVQVFLEKNKLSGTLPENIADVPSLTDLFVDGNKFTGTVPNDLCKLDLNNNFFEGEFNVKGRDGCTSIACPVNTVSREGVHPCFACGQQGTNPYLGLGGGRCFHLNEKQILDMFYDKTNGPKWDGGYGWGQPNVAVCGYEGIDCNTNGHIWNITLRGMNLRGPIAGELGFLTHLRVLDLADNKLTGYLPSDLRFAPLEYLDVSGNMLVGFVPPMLCLTGNVNGNGENDDFDCDFIACPPGKYHELGRMVNQLGNEGSRVRLSRCIPCEDEKYYLGMKSCVSPEAVTIPGYLDRNEAIFFGFGVALLVLSCIVVTMSIKSTSRDGIKSNEMTIEDDFPFGLTNMPGVGSPDDDQKLIQERDVLGVVEPEYEEHMNPRSDASSGFYDSLDPGEKAKRKEGDGGGGDPVGLFEVKGLMSTVGKTKTGTLGYAPEREESSELWQTNPHSQDGEGENDIWLDVPKIM